VDVAEYSEVKLDPNEHQDFVWATEEEVQRQAIGDREIPLTNALMTNLISKAFDMRKADREDTEKA
jgi:hypothetical protein